MIIVNTWILPKVRSASRSYPPSTQAGELDTVVPKNHVCPVQYIHMFVPRKGLGGCCEVLGETR